MEQYFRKYRRMIEDMEQEPDVTEAEFLGRLSSRSRGRMLVRIMLSAAAVLAVAVSTAVFLDSRSAHSPDPAELCLAEYSEGIRPIYEEIRQMEAESEVCREMGISSTIEELFALSEAFGKQVDNMDYGSRLEMMHAYCSRQTECVAGLYRDCLAAFVRSSGSSPYHE